MELKQQVQNYNYEENIIPNNPEDTPKKISRLQHLVKGNFDRLLSFARKITNKLDQEEQQAMAMANKQEAKKRAESQRAYDEHVTRRRKAENVARAIFAIVEYVNLITFESNARRNALLQFVKSNFNFTGEVISESYRYGHIFTSDSFSYIPTYCGTVLHCTATHRHGLVQCYRNLQQQFMAHCSENCRTCLNATLERRHINDRCDKTSEIPITTFAQYRVLYHSCVNCILCDDCASNNFNRMESCNSESSRRESTQDNYCGE